MYVTTSDKKEENELKECLYGNPSLSKLFAINQWCMIPPPTALCGYVELLSTASYPANSMAGATLVYVLPAIRENTPPQVLHIYKFSFYQQRWLHSRTHLCTNVVVKNSGSINPIVYGVMQALDQVRSLSDSVQKLANDTVLALGNIKDTLASHKMMILQNRVALDYILATQGGALYHYRS